VACGEQISRRHVTSPKRTDAAMGERQRFRQRPGRVAQLPAQMHHRQACTDDLGALSTERRIRASCKGSGTHQRLEADIPQSVVVHRRPVFRGESQPTADIWDPEPGHRVPEHGLKSRDHAGTDEVGEAGAAPGSRVGGQAVVARLFVQVSHHARQVPAPLHALDVDRRQRSFSTCLQRHRQAARESRSGFLARRRRHMCVVVCRPEDRDAASRVSDQPPQIGPLLLLRGEQGKAVCRRPTEMP